MREKMVRHPEAYPERVPSRVDLPDVDQGALDVPVGRIRCCVVGCRRTAQRREHWDQWVCARHWRLAPRLLRRHYKENQRQGDAESWPEHLALYNNLMWDQIVVHINEAARGIG